MNIFKKLLIAFRIMQDPKKVQERKLHELITWANAPVPEQEAAYVILQPKESYPYKIQYKHGEKVIGYEIKGYARTKEEAETKLAVFTKLWLDTKQPIDE